MMSLLIIYPFYNQKPLMDILAGKLKKKGLLIDILCLNNGDLISRSDVRWPQDALLVLQKSYSQTNSRLSRIRSIYLRIIFAVMYFHKVAKEYQLIDFHSFNSLEYMFLISICRKNAIPYDITLWGSDVLRAADKTFKKRKKFYLGSRCIKGSDTTIDVLRKHYGVLLKDKLRVCYFGNSELDYIDGLSEIKYSDILKSMIPCKSNKIIVVCGYNNQRAQQHQKMLEAIKQLDDCIKNKIHIVLPLTYPLKDHYIIEVKDMAELTGVSYTVLERFLTNDELAALRKASDITVNIQITDSFSSAIQSHLYCQNVVILGEWLNYPLYNKSDVFYIRTSLPDLSNTIKDAIEHLEEYKIKSLPNKKKISEMSSWDYRIMEWTQIYYDIADKVV